MGIHEVREPQHTPDDAARYRRIAAGDAIERNRMAEEHLGLASAVAVYYATRNPHLDMDDLLQEGRFGIVWALGKFNVDKGYRFSTYATFWIRHFIQRLVVANHSAGLSSKRKDTEAYLGLRMGDDDRALYDHRCIDTISMNNDCSGGDGRSMGNVLAGDDPDEVVECVMEQLDIARALSIISSEAVTPDQRRVLTMRYGVLGERPQTVPQVARRMGLRAEVVMKVERDALVILYELMEES